MSNNSIGHWYVVQPVARADTVAAARRASARRCAPEIVHAHHHGEPCNDDCQTIHPPSPMILTL